MEKNKFEKQYFMNNKVARILKTNRIIENLYAINSIMTNFYIFDAGSSLIAFDTGVIPSAAKRGMKKLEFDPNLVSHIFLTHSDSDHVGGLKVFRNAAVYMSEKEVPLATREKARKGIYRNRNIKDYITLENKQTVVVDNTHIQIISTPGHTVGSASYLINNNILFVGDTLGISRNNELVPFFSFLAMNIQENKKSFEMLKDSGLLNKKLILTSHHGIIETS